LLGTLGIRNTVLERSTLKRSEFMQEGVRHKVRMHSDSEHVIGAKAEFKDVVAESERSNDYPRHVLDRINPADDI
jgi:uncharacterized protein (DUF111 family)